MKKLACILITFMFALSVLFTGCENPEMTADTDDVKESDSSVVDPGDGGNDNNECEDEGYTCDCTDESKFNEWQKVEIEGTVCGNGSQFKFFVNYAKKSKNLILYFQAGGACWDYASCTGQTGIRGAANPNGIPDDIMSGVPGIMSPFIFRFHPWDSLPTKDWNYIFIPYCTGDVHTGNNVITYKDPGTGEELVWHHNGHKNTLAVISWIRKKFPEIDKLLVTGSSAGGIGSLVNYYFIRTGLGDRVGEAYLLNDSGPAYPALDEFPGTDPEDLASLDPDTYPHSLPLHRKIRMAWDVDSVLDELPFAFNRKDFGSMNAMLSDMFPDDRLAHTQFTRDANYSGYSYERFYAEMNSDILHRYWAEDQDNLMDLMDDSYERNGNWGYFIPYYRAFNESHCTCVLDFTDTDITEAGMDMKDYILNFLDAEKDLGRYYETPNDDELYGNYLYWDLLNFLMENL